MEEIERIKVAFGRRVSALRIRRWPKSRGPLAMLMNYTEHGIGRWERGEVLPEWYDLLRLSRHLEVTVEYLLSGRPAGIDGEIRDYLEQRGLVAVT